MIRCIDNFLPENVARNLSQQFFSDPNWGYGWNMEQGRNKETNNWNWHRSIGGDTVYGNIETKDVPRYMVPLYTRVKLELENIIPANHLIERMYSNSHTYGVDGPCHRDDGVYTVLYYPCEDWDIQWDGGTMFYNEEEDDTIEYAAYKFNRAVIFDARIPHKAMPVSRDCYRLRTSIVFKTNIDANDPAYAKWFYENQ